jgi:hypothetical protein
MAARSSHSPNSSSVVVVATVSVVVTGAGGAAAYLMTTLDWPAVVLGIVLIIALMGTIMWTISFPERTQHLASLIRAIRGGHGPAGKR